MTTRPGAASGRNALAQERHVLRMITTVSAGVGILVNIITLLVISELRGWRHPKQATIWAFLPLGATLMWDLIQLPNVNPQKISVQLQRGGDVLAFLGFLSILIVNGVTASNLPYNISVSKVMLLAYNSFPWIVCAAMHLCLGVYGTLDFSKLPRLRLEWPEAGTARHTVLAERDDTGEDMEAQTRKESNDGSEDSGEEAPLLGSS